MAKKAAASNNKNDKKAKAKDEDPEEKSSGKVRPNLYSSSVNNTAPGQRWPESRDRRERTTHPLRETFESHGSLDQDTGPPLISLTLIWRSPMVGGNCISQSRTRVLRGQGERYVLSLIVIDTPHPSQLVEALAGWSEAVWCVLGFTLSQTLSNSSSRSEHSKMQLLR